MREWLTTKGIVVKDALRCAVSPVRRGTRGDRWIKVKRKNKIVEGQVGVGIRGRVSACDESGVTPGGS